MNILTTIAECYAEAWERTKSREVSIQDAKGKVIIQSGSISPEGINVKNLSADLSQ